MVKLTEKLCKELGGKWYKLHEEYGPNACVGIKLSGAKIPRANLSKAIILDANLKEVFLGYADLSDADLGYANLSEAYLGDANLSKANFWGANLPNSRLVAIKLNEEAVKSLLEIEPYYFEEGKEQIEKNKQLIAKELLSNEKDRELIKQELLLSGV